MQQIVLSDELPAGENLLDYGCADKPYEMLFKQKFVNHIGADLPGNKHAEIEIKPDGELPSADGSFDCVLSSQVLEHVIGSKTYLREAFRVLKSGGSLIVSTHGIWPYHPDPTDFWRWTIDGLQREIRLVGFEISWLRAYSDLSQLLYNYGRMPPMRDYQGLFGQYTHGAFRGHSVHRGETTRQALERRFNIHCSGSQARHRLNRII